jgi:hypothetical protein
MRRFKPKRLTVDAATSQELMKKITYANNADLGDYDDLPVYKEKLSGECFI